MHASTKPFELKDLRLCIQKEKKGSRLTAKNKMVMIIIFSRGEVKKK
jgi:hypothetical protein